MTQNTLSRRMFVATAGLAITGTAAGCIDSSSEVRTEGEIQYVILLGESAPEGDGDWRNQRILTFDSSGIDISEYIKNNYDISEEDIGSDPLLRHLPLGEIYDNFDQVVCEMAVKLTSDDEVNDIDSGEVQVYNSYSELFDYVEIQTEYELWVGLPKDRYSTNHPRILDLATK